jgi:hypothetical protein
VSDWIYQLLTKNNIELNVKALKDKDITINECRTIIKLLKNMTVKKHCRTKYPDKNVVYLVTCKELEIQRKYIIGKSKDLTDRIGNYNKISDFKDVYVKSFKTKKQMNLAESLILEKLETFGNIL